MADGGAKKRAGKGCRAEGAGEVQRRASSPLRNQRRGNNQTRQTCGFRFLSQRRRCKESLARRDSANPALPAKEGRYPGTNERAVLAVEVRPRTRRNREPRSDVDIVLNEHARRCVAI